MSASKPTIRELIHSRSEAMTPSDQKISRALLANYPVAGLATVAELSAAARVSAPSVVRFVKRLGLAGHAELQSRIQAEIEGRLEAGSEPRPVAATEHLPTYAARHARFVANDIDETLRRLQPQELDGAVALLADQRLRIRVVGDAANAHHVAAFHRHLFALRPDCELLESDPLSRTDALMRIGKRDVIVAFDVRTATDTTEAFCRLASERGAQLIVVTDRLGGALSELARFVFVAEAGISSMLPVMCLSELLLLGARRDIGEPATDRLRQFEAQGALALGAGGGE